MLDALLARAGAHGPVFAAGISLGGSALLNWLGRAGPRAAASLAGAAAVSVPLDLTASGIAIGQGLNRLYTWHFLQTLKPKALDMARRFPDRLDAARIARARSMWDFDDAVTAPLHDFAGADDYWLRASAKPWLTTYRVADPGAQCAQRSLRSRMLAALRRSRRRQPSCWSNRNTAAMSASWPAPLPGRVDWLPARLLAFFDDQFARTGERQPRS